MLQGYRSRKYLLRILLSIIFLIVIILSMSSTVLHYSAETRIVEMQNEANRKVMNQINHNTTYMQEIVKNLALTIWKDDQIFFTLSASEEQPELNIINAMRLMSKAQDSSTFLHSIMIYNGHLDKIYAQGDMAENLKDHVMAKTLSEKLKSKTKVPQMQLIPMNVSNREHSVDFFSMIIYETFHENNNHESALIVNVKPEWIFNNLRVVNDFELPGQSNLFIIDNRGNIILSGDDQPLPALTGLKEALEQDQLQNTDKFGFFSKTFGESGRLMVSYMDMGVEGWKVVSIQPYHVVLGSIYEMRMTSLSVIVFFLLLSVALSIVIAHKLYKPVEKMIVRIQSIAGTKPEHLTRDKDELSYISNEYKHLAERLDAVTNEQDKQQRIVYNYHLRSIITGSSTYAIEQFYACVKQNKLRIVPEGQFLLVLIKFDDYIELVSQTNLNQQALYSFAIANITQEMLLPSGYSCEIVDMRSDHLVVILSTDRGQGASFEEVITTLGNVQDIVESYYKLSLTMTISEPFTGHEKITEQYGLALQYSMYKLVFGKKVIITPDLVKPNIEHSEYHFPMDQEKKLIESIKKNDLQAMQSAIHSILVHLSFYQYDHILHGILQIVDLIKTTIREINKNRVVSVSIDLSALSRQVLNKESLDEIEQLLQQVCSTISEKLQNSIEEKNIVLVDAIKEIVTVNYSDINLSLQSIAYLLKMTPAYVGRMFKKSELVSVGEYINEVRLAHALMYLETKNFSIKEIMELSGYMNQSTFFKLFKKRYGVTPKEYRLKSNIG